MLRPDMGGRHCRSRAAGRFGFTLLELMIAATLTLLMMGAVVSVFGVVSNTVNESRATMEMAERLRSTSMMLQKDLAGVTVTMMPPRDPEKNEGYFEYIEGPIGPVAPVGQSFGTGSYANATLQPAVNMDQATYSDTGAISRAVADTTAGDNDDILMFTTRRTDEPFQGRLCIRDTTKSNRPKINIVAKSSVAEVAWFVRGRTLYRRVLLVAPGAPIHDTSTGNSTSTNRPCDDPTGFYAKNDLSVHVNESGRVVPNTLGDLTKRENRFAHCMANAIRPSAGSGFPLGHYQNDFFPFDVRRWCQLGLPTLLECSSSSENSSTAPDWIVGRTASTLLDSVTYSTGGSSLPTQLANVIPQYGVQDLWSNNPDRRFANPYLRDTTQAATSYSYYSGTRYTEDVILNNVLGFDVKVWDPGAPVVAAATTAPLRSVALMPGEPGYIAALAAVNTSTNVPLAFGAYVDLNYMCRLGPQKPYDNTGVYQSYMPNYPYLSSNSGLARPASWPQPWFNSPAAIKYVANSAGGTAQTTTLRTYESYLRGHSPFNGTAPTTIPGRTYCDSWRASVYDTWSTHYNRGGRFGVRPSYGTVVTFSGKGVNGFDDPIRYVTYFGSAVTSVAEGGDGVVDDEDEQEIGPPYPYPLRGVQVKIRAFEPSSRVVREVTIVQDFVPQ